MAQMLVMIWRLPPAVEGLHNLNSFGGCSDRYTAMYCIVLFLHRVLPGQSSHSILVYNFTNMHAMLYRSEFFACSFRVNIYELAACGTVS